MTGPKKLRGTAAEIQGYFSPLVDPRLLRLRLERRTCVLTPCGLEKLCPRCRQYWPMDTEFWFANRGTSDGLFQWCRACYVEFRWPAGRRIARGEPTVQAITHQSEGGLR